MFSLQFVLCRYSDNNTSTLDSTNAAKNVNKRKLPSPVSDSFFFLFTYFNFDNEIRFGIPIRRNNRNDSC